MSRGACELCGRVVERRTRHHLIPRTRHGSRAARKRWTRAEMRAAIAWLCAPCHKQVHAVIDEKQLTAEYHSIPRLADHPEIARFVAWVRKRPADCRVVVHRQRSRR